MPSSVDTFSVTKFLPGELTITFASVIFTRTPTAQSDPAKNIIGFAAQPRIIVQGAETQLTGEPSFLCRGVAPTLCRERASYSNASAGWRPEPGG